MQDYLKTVYCLIKYQNFKENYKGGKKQKADAQTIEEEKEQFLWIFQYWGEQPQNGQYILYVVQEKLMLMKEYLYSLLHLPFLPLN